MRTILTLTVGDRPGVLDRIVGLIRRRGWNIDSLSAGDIGGGLSQITILLEGRDIDLDSLGAHLSEMDAVHDFQPLAEDAQRLREMLLIAATPQDACALSEAIRPLDGGVGCEFTGTPAAVSALTDTLRARGIRCVRSGPLWLGSVKEGNDDG